MSDETATPAPLPEGEYAIVEVLGHRTYVGRVTEVSRFGASLMSIEPLFNDRLLPAVLVGGGSIYQFTPCSAEIARQRQPKNDYQLPASIRAALPPDMLPPPEPETKPSFVAMGSVLDADYGDEGVYDD